MKQIIEALTPMNRCLMGEGYDSALEFLKHLLKFDVIEIPSGTKLETWTVPEEWRVRDAYITYKGKEILSYHDNPMCLMVGSMPFSGKVDLEELKNHLYISDDMPDSTPYEYTLYEKKWGFSLPKNVALKEKGGLWSKLAKACEECADWGDQKIKIKVQGQKDKRNYIDALPKGEYEVHIDTDFVPGKMKLAVHTIPGESDREILLFAHLDHPFQANDNLSGVACLVDLATRLKAKHTVKIIICPETIGSIAYSLTQDISKVDFVLSVDICGNNNTLLIQKSFDNFSRLNRVAHCAMQIIGKSYRKGAFRNTIGSDEYPFNDPTINIPGLLLTRWPYKEYHTDEDTADKINYEMIKETQEVIEKIIEIYEKDYIPVRKFKAPLMRGRYDLHSPNKQMNLNFDYLIFSVDGKKSLAELCADFEVNFDFLYERFERLEKDGFIGRVPNLS
jgi:aminopeptidase-like protein